MEPMNNLTCFLVVGGASLDIASIFSSVGFMFVHYTFSSDLVAEWPPFGKYIAVRSVSNLFSLYFVYL